MRLVFYTNIVSPHQLPLARELVAQLGAANYRYVYLLMLAKNARPWVGAGTVQIGACLRLLQKDANGLRMRTLCSVVIAMLASWNVVRRKDCARRIRASGGSSP